MFPQTVVKMLNSFSIPFLLAWCHLLTPSSVAEDLSQIIWMDPNARLDTPELLDAFLKSDSQVGREWAFPVTNDSWMVMGQKSWGKFRMSEALKTMKKFRRKDQRLVIDVRYEGNYKVAVKELDLVEGSKEWVTLSMRLWRAPFGVGLPRTHASQMQKYNQDKVKKSFGATYANKYMDMGYSRELLMNMSNAFKNYKFGTIPHLVMSFDIYHISTTTPELLELLAHTMLKAKRLELYTRDDGSPPAYVHVERFVSFFREYLDQKQCYLDVPQSFRDAVYPQLTTTTTHTTPEPNDSTIEDDSDDLPEEAYAGGSALEVWRGIYLLAVSVIEMLGRVVK